MNVTTEFQYCSAVSRNYGGKTREIIIISGAQNLAQRRPAPRVRNPDTPVRVHDVQQRQGLLQHDGRVSPPRAVPAVRRYDRGSRRRSRCGCFSGREKLHKMFL